MLLTVFLGRIGLSSASGCIGSYADLSVLALFLTAYLAVSVARWYRQMVVTRANIQKVCSRYNISARTGFVPEKCLEQLPEYFSPWEDIARNLHKLNRAKDLVKAVERMPLLDATRLKGNKELQRAYVVLALIGHSYLHGPYVDYSRFYEDEADVDNENDRYSKPTANDRTPLERKTPKKVPVQLARPWWIVSRALKIVPVLTHAGCDDWNWRMIDASKPASLENLELITKLTGERDEDYFHLIVTAMGLKAGPLISRCFFVRELLEERNDAAILRLLKEISECLDYYITVFGKAKALIRIGYFFHIHRRFLQGFESEHFSGVIFETETDAEYEERNLDPDMPFPQGILRCKGGSAAQFIFIQMLDVILGVKQAKDVKLFQYEMRDYMPGAHRAFLSDLTDKMLAGISLPTYVRKNSKGTSNELVNEYNRCIQKLKAFRQFHLGIAYRYITAGNKGTGSTPWKDFLKKAVDSTSMSRLPCCLGNIEDAPHPVLKTF